MVPASHLDKINDFETKNLPPWHRTRRASRSGRCTILLLCDIYLLQQSFPCLSAPSSVEGWAWQYHLQHVLGHGQSVAAVDSHISYMSVDKSWVWFRWNSKTKNRYV